MIQEGTILTICDNTGIMWVKCIKVLGPYKKKLACIGDMIIVSVQRVNPRILKRKKLHRRKRFYVGTVHRCLVVRSQSNFKRTTSVHIKFNENSAILVNKSAVPMSKRVHGPILRELCMRLPPLGCIAQLII